MAAETTFADLRRLAEGLATGALSVGRLERLALRVGAPAVPVLGRSLRTADAPRRDAARGALAALAGLAHLRPRVLAELRGAVAAAPSDECKVTALGLLAELGERTGARFEDPAAIQRRSALALAAQLESDSDVASAADLMIRQLAPDDRVAMLEIMADAAPGPAAWLCAELTGRLELDAEHRARLARAVAPTGAEDLDGAPGPAGARGASRRRAASPRPATVAVLVDAAARAVVVATRKVPQVRRWRRWAVLVDGAGLIEDCLYEDDAPAADASDLLGDLLADGYRLASDDLERARALVAAAARRSAATPGRLASSYYLGRDLLELGDAHLGGRPRAHPTSATLGRAVELLASGHPARARELLGRCGRPDAQSVDALAAAAACWLAEGQPAAALPLLRRAAAAEPAWPLHHWNLAVAALAVDEPGLARAALRAFVETSPAAGALRADPAQPARLAAAPRLLADLARRCGGESPTEAGEAPRPLAGARRPRAPRRRR